MMSYTWKRALKAMLVTSSTTSAAFMSNYFSPIMPIKAFGMFAAIIVPVNYLLVVLYYPPAIIIYEKYIQGKYCAKKKNDTEVTKIIPLTEDGEDEEMGRVERFFAGKWNNYVFKYRWHIIVFFIVWSIFASICTSFLEPLSMAEEYLPSDNRLQETLELVNEKLSSGGSSQISVIMYFGVKDVDKEGVSQWDHQTIGKTVFDPDFDISSADSQQSILDFCDKLSTVDIIVN